MYNCINISFYCFQNVTKKLYKFKIYAICIFLLILLFNQNFAQKNQNISLSDFNTCIIKSDKTLWISGNNIGLNNLSNSLKFTQIDNNAYNEVSSTNDNTFLIKNDSTLWGWGYNYNGQLGDSTRISKTILTQITKSKFNKIQSSDYGFNMAIRNDSSLMAWGVEYHGQFADNKTSLNGGDTIIYYISPTKISADKFLKVSVSNHVLAIKSDSTLWAWGYNYSGQIGDGTKVIKRVPVKISNSKFINIYAGNNFSLALMSDSTLWGWGNNSSGQLGLSDFNERLLPVQIGTRKYKYINTGGVVVVAIDLNNELYIWGNNSTGLFKEYGNLTLNTPTKIDSDKYISIATNGTTIIAQKIDGSFVGWGNDYYSQLGKNMSYKYSNLQNLKNLSDNKNFVFLSQNPYGGSYLAQKNDGSIWVWGFNTDGYLGVNDKVDRTIISNINLSKPLTKIGKGLSHTLALDSDNKLWAWGDNNGNFGDNSYSSSFIPVQVGSDLYKYAGASIGYSVFIKQDGTLWTSGKTNWGYQLGNGSNPDLIAYNKVKIDNTNTYLTAFPGLFSVFAIHSDSSLWAWGLNRSGLLGDGTTTEKYVPTKISNIKFKKVSNFNHVLAIENNGNLWAWGSNYGGQVGNGTTNGVLSPTKISNDVWIDVSSTGSMSYAIKNDSTLWAWGSRSDGLFGAGSPSSSYVPIKVSDIKYRSISASDNEIIAVKSDGTLVSIGKNTRGSLGIGELDYYLTSQLIFSVPSPLINYISSKIISNGSQILIRGENLSNITSVSYSNHSCTFEIISDNIIKIVIPSNVTKSGSLIVITGSGVVTQSDIMYLPPESNSAPIDIVLTNNIIEENNSVNRPIGHFIADDAESNTEKFELISGIGSEDNVNFYIDSNRLVTKISFDYETKNSYTIRVKAIDSLGLSLEKLFNINVIDDPESILNKTNVKVYASSSSNGFVLKNDSTLWGWSSNSSGQLGDGTFKPQYGLVQITQDKYLDFATNGSTVIAIKSDSSLWAWGNNNEFGLYGDGTTGISNLPVKVSSDKFLKISMSSSHSIAIRSDGTLWAWGYNYSGQVGDGTTITKAVRVKISNEKYTEVKAASSKSYAIKSDGTLWAWGNNSFGLLGDGTKINKFIPTIISNEKFKSISTMHNNSNTMYAMGVDSSLWSWGVNNYGQLGQGLNKTDTSFYPRKIGNDKFIDFSVGLNYVMAIKADSSLWGVGLNSGNRMGDTVSTFFNTFRKISNNKFARIYSSSSTFSIAVLNNGIAYWYGSGNLNNIFKYRQPYLNNFTKVSNAKNLQINNSFFQKSDLSWWSRNSIYLNSSADIIKIDKVRLKNYNFVKIEGNSSYTGLTKEGYLYTWGYNYLGQLGNGNNLNNLIPTKLGNDKYIDFSTNSYSTIAIKQDGSLWSWGYNGQGELGDSTLINRNIPVKIEAGPFVAINLSNDGSAYAIKQDGTLFAWGSNYYSQLGDGTNIAKKSPVQIGFNKFNKVVSENYHVVAFAKDSTVWTWGYNSSGQIGDNTTLNRSTPYNINIGNNVKFIDVGISGYNGTSYAVKSDGSLYSWGDNTTGLLGDGTFTNYYQPKIVSNDLFKSISIKNDNFVYFIKEDSSTYMLGTSGSNFYTPTTSYFSMLTPLFNLYPNFTPFGPITHDTIYCNSSIALPILANASIGNKLLYYTQEKEGSATNNPFVPSTIKPDTLIYFVSQVNVRGFESERKKLTVIIKDSLQSIITAPIISKDNNGNLVSSALNGNIWYKNGILISDTSKSIKPNGNGGFKVKNIYQGCTSPTSAEYYYLTTDLFNLGNDQFIKLVPNPVLNDLYFDFKLKGYQKLNLEVFDFTKGSKLLIFQNQFSGSKINLSSLSTGLYIINVTSVDNKINYKFKIIKI